MTFGHFGNEQYISAPGPSSGLPPISQVNLQLWMRSDVGVTGSPLTAWQDASPNQFAFVPEGTGTATLESDEINGLPVVRFDGTINSIMRNLTASPMEAATEVFVAVVIKQDGGGGGNKYIVSFPEGSGLQGVAMREADTARYGGLMGYTGGADEGVQTTSNTLNDDVARIFSTHWTSAGASYTLYINNDLEDTEATSAGAITADADEIYLGNISTSFAGYWAGDLAEVIVYNRDIDATERLEIWTYLADKWGITLS